MTTIEMPINKITGFFAVNSSIMVITTDKKNGVIICEHISFDHEESTVKIHTYGE